MKIEILASPKGELSHCSMEGSGKVVFAPDLEGAIALLR